jgi:hypothetical protein
VDRGLPKDSRTPAGTAAAAGSGSGTASGPAMGNSHLDSGLCKVVTLPSLFHDV